MHTGFLWQAIYWFSTPALAVVVAVLFVRRVQRRFPLFVFYVFLLLLIDLVRLLAFYGLSRRGYFYVYWISDAVGSLFALLVAGELMLRRLFAHFQKVRFYRYLFLFAGVVIAGLTLLTVYSSNPALLLSVLIKALHASDVFLTAMLLFFVALMLFMGRRWSQYEFGIALGLGINAAALLLTFAIFSKSGPLQSFAREIPVFGEDGAALAWLLFFLKPEKPTPAVTKPVSPEVLDEARKWEETLKGSLTGKKRPD